MAKKNGFVMRVSPEFRQLCLQLKPRMEKAERKLISLTQVTGRIAESAIIPIDDNALGKLGKVQIKFPRF